MTLQDILVILFIGIVAGFLAGKIVEGTGYGLIGDLVLGIVGAFIGNWLLPLIGIHVGFGILAAILNATVGAVFLLVVLGLIRRAGQGARPG